VEPRFYVNTYFISYYVHAQKLVIATNRSISIATVEFYSTYFYIFWHFLHISWDVMYNYIFRDIFYLNFKQGSVYFFCISVKYLTDSLLHPSKDFSRNDSEIRKEISLLQSRVNYNPQVIPLINLTCGFGILLMIRMVFLYIADKIPSPLTKRTRPLLATCLLVLKILKVSLVLCGQFKQMSSGFRSRYRYGASCILSGVKVKFVGKNRRFLHSRR
jgi:hypothetical protein